ncbi:MAG: 4-hydroxy-tetrahydrodipicolinate synthase [Bacteroidetes bacterium]|nr:4-hydroxy-tetrahydrodipicolinate synthase [Bacteroidota bacterium]
MNTFFGTGTALVTPFRADHSVDFDALTRIVEHQIANGTNYFVILGTTGEVATLTADEKKAVTDHIIRVTAGRIPLVLGVGGNNTQALVQQLETMDFAGLSAVLSVSPYYNKPNQEGIYQHYIRLAEASELPVILYNVPGRTGSNMTVETTLRLAEHENIIGIKEASGNMEQVMRIIAKKPADFIVISGDDALTFPMLACGAVGVISVINHAYPRQFSGMVKAALENRWDDARKLHYECLEGSLAIFADGSPGGIKVMLNEMGLCENVVRQPLWPVSEAVEKRLRGLVMR